jgi:hypothetical protein
VIDAIRTLVEKSPHLTSEGSRFTFSMIVQRVGQNLSSAPLSVSPFHLTQTGRLSNLGNSVDGVSSCYLVDQQGKMSIVEVPISVRKSTASDTIMELSRVKNSLAIYVGIDLARVYSSGEVTRTFRKGIWVEQPKVDFASLVKDGYSTDILGPVMALCMRLSELSKQERLLYKRQTRQLRANHSETLSSLSLTSRVSPRIS